LTAAQPRCAPRDQNARIESARGSTRPFNTAAKREDIEVVALHTNLSLLECATDIRESKDARRAALSI